VKLFSQNSNLYDHDTSTLQRDGQTDGWTDNNLPGNTALRADSHGKNYSSALSFLNDLLFCQ